MAIKKITLNPKTDGHEHLFPHETHHEEPEAEASEDINGRRKVLVGGHTYELISTDPYGFWHIKMGHGGKVPKALEGQFTGQSEAEQAIEAYEASRVVHEPFHSGFEKE